MLFEELWGALFIAAILGSVFFGVYAYGKTTTYRPRAQEQRGKPIPPRWDRRRTLYLLLVTSALTALVNALLILLLPLCRTESGSVSCLREAGPEIIWFGSPPVLACAVALILARWRVARILAAGVLWFYTLAAYWPFYAIPAFLQTASSFVSYRREPIGTVAERR